MTKENVLHRHYGVIFSHKEERNYVFVEKWIELEIILSEISQTQKDNYWMLSLMWNLYLKK
jgi:hypothetical protein